MVDGATRRRGLAGALAVAALSLALASGAARADERLEVGFGRRSLVTERRDLSLGGYGGRGLVPIHGLHDETYAKAMVIRTPERAIAIVTLDLIGVQRTILDALWDRGFPARVRLDREGLLLAASRRGEGQAQ